MNPPPIISTGTSSNAQEGVLVAPSATLSNSRTILRKVFRPNNYRRKVAMPNSGIKCYPKIKESYSQYSMSAHNKLIFIRDYPGVVLQVGKFHVVGIWSQGDGKLTYHLEGSPDEIAGQIAGKVGEIGGLIDRSLADFFDRMGMVFGVPVWERYEDWTLDPVLDGVPMEQALHDVMFKKVYGRGLEFVQSPLGESPGVHLTRFIRNRALEDVVPQLAGELASLRREQASQFKVLLGAVSRLQGLDRGVVLAGKRRGQQVLGRWLV